eukprot:2852368-Amphidinium_carterae.1
MGLFAQISALVHAPVNLLDLAGQLDLEWDREDTIPCTGVEAIRDHGILARRLYTGRLKPIWCCHFRGA